MSLTHLSLFSGIGALDAAAEHSGFTTLAMVEKDPCCQEVLKRHWPEVPVYDDVSTFDARPFVGVDLVSGGFPCQDISAAKPGAAGIDGARSGLWRHMLRVVRECEPRFVFIENSPAARVRGIDRVFAELGDAGYTGGAFVVGAAHAGAPHFRARMFLVAHANGFPQCPNRGQGRQVRHPQRDRQAAQRGRPQLGIEPRGIAWWNTEPGVCRVAPGLTKWVDNQLRMLGNACPPQQYIPVLTAIAGELQAARELQESAA